MNDLIAFFKKADPVIADIMVEVGPLTETKPQSAFATLVSAIISQQLSVKAAKTIHKRLVQLMDGEVDAESLLRLESDNVRAVGISGQKQGYLRSLSEHFLADEEIYNNLDRLDDEAVIEQLTRIKGIGRWTAEMYLMFNLGRPDVFPFDDLGIRQNMERLYNIPTSKKPDRSLYEAIAAKWSPHRTAACRYLWASKDIKK